MRKTTYAFKYVAGLIEHIQDEWHRFEATRPNETCLTEVVEFIPALGGCFIVLNYERSTSFGFWPSPPKDAATLLDDFLSWHKQQHPSLPTGRSIMVVDDDQATLKLLHIIFENAGFSVRGYGEARAALDALASPTEPDILVVDLRMPGMDGRAFIHNVKASGVGSKLVIASGFGAQRAKLELGADASIDKPFLPDDIVDLVSGLTFGKAS